MFKDLDDFETQIVMHPEISYAGRTVNRRGAEYNQFVYKSSWTEFATLRHGLAAPGSAAGFFWPWDIAYFIKDAGLEFIRVLMQKSELIYRFWSPLEKILTQDVAQQFLRNDLATWQRFFSRLGNHPEFIQYYPGWAKLCRWLAGEEGSPVLAAELEPGFENDDKAKELVAVIATDLGLVIAGTIGVVGFIIGVISAAAGAAAFAGRLGLPIAIGAVVLVHLAVLGWAIGVALAIVDAVMRGLLIFGSGPVVEESTLAYPQVLPAAV